MVTHQAREIWLSIRLDTREWCLQLGGSEKREAVEMSFVSPVVLPVLSAWDSRVPSTGGPAAAPLQVVSYLFHFWQVGSASPFIKQDANNSPAHRDLKSCGCPWQPFAPQRRYLHSREVGVLREIPPPLSLLQRQRGKSQKVWMLLGFNRSGIARENNKSTVSFLVTTLQSSSSNPSAT